MSKLLLVQKKLSQACQKRFEEQFDSQILQRLYKGFAEERKTVIRINTLKTSLSDVMDILRKHHIHFERVAFLTNSLILKHTQEKYFESKKNEEAFQLYNSGSIYFQGISSQIPVLFLHAKTDEKILDVSSAPGSKTTQIGIAMQNQGELVANEIDAIRYERLKYNLEKQGITNAKTVLGDGIALGYDFPEYFDKILLDAPCSAEGRICVQNPRTYRFWTEKNIIKNAKLQRRLFQSAIKALKPGGTLVYSTCTLAPEENEMIVDWALEKFNGENENKKIKLLDCQLDFNHLLPILTSFQGKTFSKEVQKTLKASPSDISEGFFIAVFKKL